MVSTKKDKFRSAPLCMQKLQPWVKAGVNKNRRSDHLCLWVETEHLLNELNESNLTSSVRSLLNVFGSDLQILSMLMQLAEISQLKQVHELLNLQHMKQSEEVGNTASMPSSPFNIISRESIQNICGYLSHDDVEEFKNTSRRMSIICLQEMTKYEIGICNTNELLGARYSTLIQWCSSRYLKTYRCSKNTSYLELFELIQKRDGIALQNQIYQQTYKSTEDYQPIKGRVEYRWSGRILDPHSNISPQISFVVFDKSNITLLDAVKFRKMNENDVYDQNRMLLVLYYFDVGSQTMEAIQFLMINVGCSAKRIREFIQYDLIPNNARFMQLQSAMHQLDEEEEDRLVLYLDNQQCIHWRQTTMTEIDCNRNPYIFDIDSRRQLMSIIFQINPHSQQMIDLWSRQEIAELARLRRTAMAYVMRDRERSGDDVRELRLSYYGHIGKLKSQIKAWMHYEETNGSFEAISAKLNVFKNNAEVTLQMGERLRVRLALQMLKQHICMMYFDDVIHWENIKLDRCGSSRLTFKLVPYDTTERHMHRNRRRYEIEIYKDYQCPFPYNKHKTACTPATIDVIYGASGDWKGLLEHILSEAGHSFFTDEFSQFIAYYDEDAWDLEWYFVIMNAKHGSTPKLYAPYIGNLYSQVADVSSYKLFFIASDDPNRKHKLRVMFVWEDTFDPSACFDQILHQRIGFPLTVWINECDTLEYVLNSQYLVQYESDIVHSYRFLPWSRCNEIDLIETEKRSSYTICSEMHCFDVQWILLTLKRNDDINATHYDLQF